MPINQAIGAADVFPRPVAGHRHAARIVLNNGETIDMLTTSAEITETLNWQFTSRALTPPEGPKQRVLHSKGTKEVSWSIAGDLSAEAIGLMGFFAPTNVFQRRGARLSQIIIQQGLRVEVLQDVYWSSISLSGSPNSAITFSIEGRGLIDPLLSGLPLALTDRHHPVPSWTSGALLVSGWTLTRSVPLNPVFWNRPEALPKYYRPGDTEMTLEVETAIQPQDHDLIKVGLGEVGIAEAVVTSRTRSVGGSNEHQKFRTSLANARFTDEPGVISSFQQEVRTFPRPGDKGLANVFYATVVSQRVSMPNALSAPNTYNGLPVLVDAWPDGT